MKKYMILHYGFKKPTPEIMGAWGKWFKSIADKMVDQGGFHGGARKISDAGTKDLSMGMKSITGYNIINAENLEEAVCAAEPGRYADIHQVVRFQATAVRVDADAR